MPWRVVPHVAPRPDRGPLWVALRCRQIPQQMQAGSAEAISADGAEAARCCDDATRRAGREISSRLGGDEYFARARVVPCLWRGVYDVHDVHYFKRTAQ